MPMVPKTRHLIGAAVIAAAVAGGGALASLPTDTGRPAAPWPGEEASFQTAQASTERYIPPPRGTPDGRVSGATRGLHAPAPSDGADAATGTGDDASSTHAARKPRGGPARPASH